MVERARLVSNGVARLKTLSFLLEGSSLKMPLSLRCLDTWVIFFHLPFAGALSGKFFSL